MPKSYYSLWAQASAAQGQGGSAATPQLPSRLSSTCHCRRSLLRVTSAPLPCGRGGSPGPHGIVHIPDPVSVLSAR